MSNFGTLPREIFERPELKKKGFKIDLLEIWKEVRKNCKI